MSLFFRGMSSELLFIHVTVVIKTFSLLIIIIIIIVEAHSAQKLAFKPHKMHQG